MDCLKWGGMTLLLVSCSATSGIVLGGTRFIFSQEEKTLVVSLRNSENKPFLMHSKIVSDNGLSTSGVLAPLAEPQKPPFIATPPIVVVNGKQEQQIVIIHTGGTLPTDRESLFWLSVTAIPPSPPADGNPRVQIAVSQQVKLIWRPQTLPKLASDERTPLRWQRRGQQVIVSNDTPWYVTLSSFEVNGKSIKGGMIPPFNQRANSWCPIHGKCQIAWQMLDDNGQPLRKVEMSLR